MSFERPPIPAPQESDPEIPEIPEGEIVVTFARSGGPGGQNVNKTNSKAHARWHVMRSEAPFTPEQRERILERAPKSRVTEEGFIIASSQEERDQPRNKAKAIEILRELVAEALEEDPERVPTKPTRGSKERRMDEKSRHGQKKQARRKGNWD